MYIHEAINARSAEKPHITRLSWTYTLDGFKVLPISINPTDTPDGCVLVTRASRTPCRGWQPRAEDLAADDWEPVACTRKYQVSTAQVP